VSRDAEVLDRDDLPRDPDYDAVPDELTLLAGLDEPESPSWCPRSEQVTVLDEDGASRDQLVIVPGLFGQARRLEDG
jgi:hypothetical protein